MENEPQGIGFYNIKSGETRHAKTEPQIQGYINSSDMGINASRGQDFGWRLSADWVKLVRAFRRDETKMSVLMANNNGQAPTTTNILYAIYGEQLRAYEQKIEDNESPFEEEYLKEISTSQNVTNPKPLPVVGKVLGAVEDEVVEVTSKKNDEVKKASATDK